MTPFIAILLMFVAVSMAIALLNAVIRGSASRVLASFSSNLRMHGDALVLPEVLDIELGDLRIEGVWRRSGRSSYYDIKLEVLDREDLSTNVVDLKKLCSKSFYVYVLKDNTVLILSPGFIVRSGKFKDIAILCFDKSRIPLKKAEIKVGIDGEGAEGFLEVGPEGVKAEVKWIFEAPLSRRAVFDEKKGVYRFVEEYMVKPRSRSARIELGFLTPFKEGKSYRVIAEVRKPNTSSKGVHLFSLRSTPTVIPIHIKLLRYNAFDTLSKVFNIFDEHATGIPVTNQVVAGYREGVLSAKLVLDIPMARDVVEEKPL